MELNQEKYLLMMLNNNETKHISELLQELMQERGISVDKLSLVTNIPRRFVVSLLEGDFKRLPAKPYIRGYLARIAAAMSIEQALLFRAYKNSTEVRSSGEKDVLPMNRFAIQKVNKNFIVVFLIITVIITFLAWRMKDILGEPSIEVNLPETTLVTQEQVISVSGSINPKDRLTLNHEMIYTDETGKFEKEISLSPGLNTFEFNVKRFLGRETNVVKQILYEETVKVEIPEPEQQ